MNKAKQLQTTVSDLEDHLGFWLRFVSNHVSDRFALLLDEHGVSGTEWVAMRTLYGKSAATHSSLIEALGMTKGATSKVITRLEGKGLAQRSQGEANGREQNLELTAKGKKLVPTLAALADQNDAHFFGHLSTHDKKALAKLMKDIVGRQKLKQVPTK